MTTEEESDACAQVLMATEGGGADAGSVLTVGATLTNNYLNGNFIVINQGRASVP